MDDQESVEKDHKRFANPAQPSQASPSKMPASLASKSREELADLLVGTLRQLKSRDQKIHELQQELSASVAATESAAEVDAEAEARIRAQETELTALREKHEALEKELAGLRTDAADRDAQLSKRQTSDDEITTLRKSQAKLKKAVIELKKRNESLDARQKEAESARSAAVDELRKAEAQLAARLADVERSAKALTEYKQKAHALLKSKDEEIKSGSTAIRETLENELAKEKAARKAAESERDMAVEDLGKARSQVAGQLHDAELQYKERISQLQKELELQASHAKNAATRIQQLQVRYESVRQRYESLRNSTMDVGEVRANGPMAANGHAEVAAIQRKLEEALHALDRAKAEVSASAQINDVLEQEVLSLKATIKQLRLTLAMKGSIKTPFNDLVVDVPPSPFSPADDAGASETDHGRGELPAATMDTAMATAAMTATMAVPNSLQEKLSIAERKASVAERELDDLELEIRLRETQERALKDTIRELEGEIHRLKLTSTNDGVDIEYLKNILVQVFKGAQDELSLLLVVAKILRLTPEEVGQCTAAVNARKAQVEAGYLGQVQLPDLSSFMPAGWGGS